MKTIYLILTMLFFSIIAIGNSNAGSVKLPSEYGASEYLGIWVNEDDQSRGLTTVNISNDSGLLQMQVQASCSPQDCNWGTTVFSFDSLVPINPSFDFGFKTVDLEIQLIDINTLYIESINRFTDSSRGGYENYYYMVREN